MHAPVCKPAARRVSISTRPGSSSGGSVSGGQASVVTPPAAAARISDSSVALVLEAGLAQPRGEIDEPRNRHEALRVDGLVRLEAVGRLVERRHFSIGDEDRAFLVAPDADR
jgi:hypothetical protein